MGIVPRLNDESKYNDDIMFDATNPEVVEIQISSDGKVWVNCDGKCRFRAYVAKNIILVDERNVHESSRKKSK